MANRSSFGVREGEDGNAVVEGDRAGAEPLAHFSREQCPSGVVDRDRAERDEAEVPLASDQTGETGLVDPAVAEHDLAETLAVLLPLGQGLLELFRRGDALLDHQGRE